MTYPHAELVVFEHSGHHPYAEDPDAFLAAVHGWLARGQRPAPTP